MTMWRIPKPSRSFLRTLRLYHLLLLLLPTTCGLSIAPTDKVQKASMGQQKLIFNATDCTGTTKPLQVQLWSGETASKCGTEKIYKKPISAKAQLLSLSNDHPVNVQQCSIWVRATTSMCGSVDVINHRNVELTNKIILEETIAPDGEACMKAMESGTLTWSTPPLGFNYFGDVLHTKLKDGLAHGEVFAYNEKNTYFGCKGFSWLSFEKMLQLMKVLA